jgi:hypothetical protein
MGTMIKPKGRRGGKRKPPSDIPPPGNTKADALVEVAEAKLTGGAKTELREGIDQVIAADPYLFLRPRLRWFMRLAGTENVCNLDGTPMMAGPEGKKVPINATWMVALARAEMARALAGDVQAREFCMPTLFTPPPKPMEVSGPAGGPIEMTAQPAATLSPEEMAGRMLRAMRIAQEIMARQQTAPALEGVEVSASTNSEGALLPPTPVVGATPAPAPAGPAAAKPGPPVVGSLPVRRG